MNTLLPRASGGGGTRSVTEGVLFLRSCLLSHSHLLFRNAANHVQHAFQMITHIRSGEPNDFDSVFTHPCVTALVSYELFARMHRAIDFDNQSRSVAVEICDVWADGDLFAKVKFVEFLRFDREPEPAFWRREFSAELLCL